jgi:hypothetical protein
VAYISDGKLSGIKHFRVLRKLWILSVCLWFILDVPKRGRIDVSSISGVCRPVGRIVVGA